MTITCTMNFNCNQKMIKQGLFARDYGPRGTDNFQNDQLGDFVFTEKEVANVYRIEGGESISRGTARGEGIS